MIGSSLLTPGSGIVRKADGRQFPSVLAEFGIAGSAGVEPVIAWDNLRYLTGMQFIVELPDELARQFIPVGCDPARVAVEDMAVEAYRGGRLTEHQLATLLGMARYELDGFLKKREVWLDYTEGELRREVEVGERL